MDTPNTTLSNVSDLPTGQIKAMQERARQLLAKHPTWPAKKLMKEVAKEFKIKLVNGQSPKYRKQNPAK